MRFSYCGLLWAIVVLVTSQAAGQEKPSMAEMPGQLVDIGGHRLHIHCAGSEGGGPTVVFESGGGGSAKDWTKVREALGPGVRSCAYDRAGLGWSEKGPEPRTLRQEVFEFQALLDAAEVRGPVVLVGQSIGGLLVRMYAAQHLTNVAGVVLVDPTHENSVLGSLRYGGWVRLREKATGRALPERRLKGEQKKEDGGDKVEIDYLAEEFQGLYLARQKNPQPFGDKPLIVLGAGKRQQPPGTPDEQWETIRREKEEQVRDQARLSRNSKFVNDPSSGHHLHLDNPQLVARAIAEVMGAAGMGKRLEY